MIQTNKRKIRLTTWGASKIILLDMICTLVISTLIILISKALGVSSKHPLFDALNKIIPLIIVFIVLNKKFILSVKSNLIVKKEHFRIIVPLVIAITGVNIVMSEVGNYIKLIFPMSDFWKEAFKSAFSGEINMIWTIISVVIIASITEEILLRGIVLDGLLRRHSVVKSVVISALLFGLMHLNIYQFSSAFVGGLLLGWVFAKTKSLFLCIVGHSINNSLGFIVSKLLNLQIPGYSTEGFQPLWFTVMGIVLLIVGVLLLRKRMERDCYISETISEEQYIEGDDLTEKFKIKGKSIICFLLTTLLIGSILVSREINQSKIDEAKTAYMTHPRRSEIYRLSPKNIGVIKKKFNEDYIRGYHHIPYDIQHKGVVITFGGSEGSMNEYMANYLSSDGYEVVAVYYFGQKGQSENIERVPLEIYEEIYSYIKANCKNSDTITILGTSRGAELALLLSTYYDTIDNVVLIAPTSHVNIARYFGETSSWTYNGKDVDYLNGNIGIISIVDRVVDLLLNKPYDNFILLRNRVIRKSTNLEEARIKVENSNAKILMFYGEDDRVWDARSSSNIIKEYAKNEIIIHGYENSGHDFSGGILMKEDGYYMVNGGNLDSNIEADLDSKRILLEILELWHK
ncbi:type II CAAX prenyl endopeptidase Rce1 family protein [Tissierella sp.]|uniref:CPBP family glutamic-type intramembrane protease n=1 Tax=Tissierella sp. TaxID=41274 RepID=UPI0028676EB3|nr:CPBP family glutamic-type intramembrane protease [Tissierella sp.]MDR7855084.1 CPBP family glutamic-type intramembrane protease [Tissierella sp.]